MVMTVWVLTVVPSVAVWQAELTNVFFSCALSSINFSLVSSNTSTSKASLYSLVLFETEGDAARFGS